MIAQSLPAVEPEEILSDLLGLDPGLVRHAYYGERSIFYNPGGRSRAFGDDRRLDQRP